MFFLIYADGRLIIDIVLIVVIKSIKLKKT